MMKKILALLLALTMALALAACGAPKENTDDTKKDDSKDSTTSDLAYVKDKGKLTIGYTIAPPMNYIDDATNEFTGFDTELAKLVCAKLGVEPNFQEITWDAKVMELDTKNIDCIWNGMTIKPELQEATEITRPYAKNAQVILMKNTATYDDTTSLIGKNIAAEQGSAAQDLIAADENLKQANFIPKKRQIDCLMEVKAGTADAAILDLTLASKMIEEGTSYTDLKIMGRMQDEDYGIAFRKGSDLCAEVNKILDELTADGSITKLADKYKIELPKAAE